MRIYVGGLWAGVSRAELDCLVRESLRGPWYKLHMPRGRLADCQLYELQGAPPRPREYCAVIQVEPHRLGWEVVQRLDGIHHHGHALAAHRWFSRKGLRDRRASDINDEFPAVVTKSDRRMGRDRRRGHEMRRLGPTRVEAVSGFQRSYGG